MKGLWDLSSNSTWEERIHKEVWFADYSKYQYLLFFKSVKERFHQLKTSTKRADEDFQLQKIKNLQGVFLIRLNKKGKENVKTIKSQWKIYQKMIEKQLLHYYYLLPIDKEGATWIYQTCRNHSIPFIMRARCSCCFWSLCADKSVTIFNKVIFLNQINHIPIHLFQINRIYTFFAQRRRRVYFRGKIFKPFLCSF